MYLTTDSYWGFTFNDLGRRAVTFQNGMADDGSSKILTCWRNNSFSKVFSKSIKNVLYIKKILTCWRNNSFSEVFSESIKMFYIKKMLFFLFHQHSSVIYHVLRFFFISLDQWTFSNTGQWQMAGSLNVKL